jgi:hypothetical protein
MKSKSLFLSREFCREKCNHLPNSLRNAIQVRMILDFILCAHRLSYTIHRSCIRIGSSWFLKKLMVPTARLMTNFSDSASLEATTFLPQCQCICSLGSRRVIVGVSGNLAPRLPHPSTILIIHIRSTGPHGNADAPRIAMRRRRSSHRRMPTLLAPTDAEPLDPSAAAVAGAARGATAAPRANARRGAARRDGRRRWRRGARRGCTWRGATSRCSPAASPSTTSRPTPSPPAQAPPPDPPTPSPRPPSTPTPTPTPRPGFLLHRHGG